ncbi:flavoprotein [Catenulispora yoronensis]|uniref:Flavoprotein n=1 Tax=Catenulispora yoronensis TaxID=450799 RepID=A0ABP5F7J2_9ACTN
MADNPVLYVIVCAAGPAERVTVLIEDARARGWDPYVVPTPTAEEFLDLAEVERVSGHPVRSRWRTPGEGGSLPTADAIVVAPASYNTINKWAAGVADCYALGLLAELGGAGVPIAVLPNVNTAFAANRVYQRSLTELRESGVQVLVGPGLIEPHPPRTDNADSFPWHLALDALDALDAGRPSRSAR